MEVQGTLHSVFFFLVGHECVCVCVCIYIYVHGICRNETCVGSYMAHFINNTQGGKTAEWMMQSQ